MTVGGYSCNHASWVVDMSLQFTSLAVFTDLPYCRIRVASVVATMSQKFQDIYRRPVSVIQAY